MQDTRSKFTQNGIRCTSQRIAVYEALCGTTAHPTAEELLRMVRPRIDRLSLATVYNTLEVLCDAGLCRRLPTDGGCRYDADTTDHVHVRMRDSGAIRDVPSELGARISEQISGLALAEIERRLGVKIDAVSIQLLAREANWKSKMIQRDMAKGNG